MSRISSQYSELREKFTQQIPPLKRVIPRSGFLTYYFIHRPKIKKWNNESDLIIFKYFGIKMNIADDFKSRIDDRFVSLLSKLKGHIDILVKSGWKMHFISIYEYNVLVNFKDFYERYYQVFKSEELNKVDFLNLERAYVSITYRESYLDVLFGIFEKYLKTYNTIYEGNSEKYDKLLLNLRFLFEKSSFPHSLRELILAYNVTELHGFYRWSELFPPISTDIVQSQWFNCSSDVHIELVSYYKTIKSSMKSLEAEKEGIRRIQSNCIINDNDSPPILVKFYQTGKHNWDLDKSDYYLLFLLVMEGLVSHLEYFILREWKIIDNNEKLHNQRLIDDDILPALYRKLKREFDMAFVYYNADNSQRMNVLDFREVDEPETLINSDQQKKMFSSFEDLLSIIYDISNKILSYRDLASESGYSKNTYLKFMVDSPSDWAGKPVFYVFNYYVELLWTTCGYFKHKKFINMDDRLEEIKEELKKLSIERDRIESFNTLDGAELEK